MMQLVILPVASLFLSCVTTVAASDGTPAYSWHSYPNPQKADGKCGLPEGEKAWICDPDNMLSKDSLRQLNRLISTIRNETSCPCSQNNCDETSNQGYNFAVALVPHIEQVQDGDSENWSDDVWDNLQKAMQFSLHTYKEWNVGRCNDHVFIVYSRDGDGVIYTLVGTAAAAKLKDHSVVSITSNVRTKFMIQPDTKKPDPDQLMQGLHKMMNDYRAVLEGSLVLGTQPPPTAQAVRGNVASAVQFSYLTLHIFTLIALVFKW